MSRFPGLVQAGEKGSGMVYEVFMTGTPPERMRWKFVSYDKDLGFTVYLKYPSALSRSVTIDGTEVPYNDWTRATPENGMSADGYGPIEQKECGENRYVAVDNYLEFYIDPSCQLGIQPRDAI